jgi:hypothetical protein
MSSSDIIIGDTVRQRALGYIRTGVPALIGALLTWAGSRIPAVFDFLSSIEPEWRNLLYSIITAAVIFGYYWAARQLGKRWPRVERLMLGSSKTPVYVVPEGVVTVQRTAAAVNEIVQHKHDNLEK